MIKLIGLWFLFSLTALSVSPGRKRSGQQLEESPPSKKIANFKTILEESRNDDISLELLDRVQSLENPLTEFKNLPPEFKDRALQVFARFATDKRFEFFPSIKECQDDDAIEIITLLVNRNHFFAAYNFFKYIDIKVFHQSNPFSEITTFPWRDIKVSLSHLGNIFGLFQEAENSARLKKGKQAHDDPETHIIQIVERSLTIFFNNLFYSNYDHFNRGNDDEFYDINCVKCLTYHEQIINFLMEIDNAMWQQDLLEFLDFRPEAYGAGVIKRKKFCFEPLARYAMRLALYSMFVPIGQQNAETKKTLDDLYNRFKDILDCSDLDGLHQISLLSKIIILDKDARPNSFDAEKLAIVANVLGQAGSTWMIDLVYEHLLLPSLDNPDFTTIFAPNSDRLKRLFTMFQAFDRMVFEPDFMSTFPELEPFLPVYFEHLLITAQQNGAKEFISTNELIRVNNLMESFERIKEIYWLMGKDFYIDCINEHFDSYLDKDAPYIFSDELEKVTKESIEFISNIKEFASKFGCGRQGDFFSYLFYYFFDTKKKPTPREILMDFPEFFRVTFANVESQEFKDLLNESFHEKFRYKIDRRYLIKILILAMKSEEFGYRDLGFAQIREGLTELRKGDDVNLKAHYLTLKQKFLVETEKTREEF